MTAAPKGCAWLLYFSIGNLVKQSRGLENNLLNKGSDNFQNLSKVLEDVRMFVGGVINIFISLNIDWDLIL